MPYPNFGFIEWRTQTGRSQYKGIDLGLEKRFANGYSFGVAYTLGDSKDNTSEHLSTQGSNAFPQNSRDFEAWYGPSDYDVRHRLAVNFVVELPFGANKKYLNSGVGRAILGGWTVSGIFTARSGRPFTVNQANNNVGANMTGLPNQVGDPEGPKTVDEWFNMAAFQAVTSGTFGNEGRNQLRGPNWQSVRPDLLAAFRFQRARRRHAALGRVQRLQPHQLRLAEPQPDRPGHAGHDHEPRRRCAHHAGLGPAPVLGVHQSRPPRRPAATGRRVRA